MLRNACYIVVVALSMMRDSEIHEITRGAIVDYYGTPAIKATKGKLDPNLPIKHWWITAPVAEAVVVAEQLSTRHDRLFPPLHRAHAVAPRSGQMLDAFIAHINVTSARTGLQTIPPGNVRPHMFRTMAMLTDQFPSSEIALGIQLKHIASRALANRSTQGYANADSSWAAHLESAIEAARFRRLEDLYQTHKAGKPIGYGPAAERMTQTFNEIHHNAQARGGDATVQRALLRNAGISIRFGVLNHWRDGREQPRRRGLPRTRRRARRPQGTATRSVSPRPMRQQHHRTGTLADLGLRAAHPADTHRHARTVDLPQRSSAPRIECGRSHSRQGGHQQGAGMNSSPNMTDVARHDDGVSPRAAKRLRDAMDRLLAGRPQRTDGRLIKDNLWREAGLSRATMNRAVQVLAEWNARVVACEGFTPREARKNDELTTLRVKLADKTRECTELHHRLDAAAALHHDNALLRQELSQRRQLVSLQVRR